MTINILDDLTISRIAAGEIIENPASIVKELIENSIDAKAKNIVIEIKGAAWEYIKVFDDGEGIPESEIEKAFYRHATSKLSNFNDLENITSLGFRGEALASIASVAKVEVLTKTKNDLAGTRAILENGKIIDKSNVGIPVGTTFYITDVFYNTPVRRKFLKRDSSEFNSIQDVVKKIALGTPNVSFKLIKDSRVVFSKVSTNDYKNHIFSILGRDFSNHLIEKKYDTKQYKINAFFSDNYLYRTSRSEQYIYINGRFVKNLDISKSIEKAYYSQIPLGRFPVYIIYIEIDPSIVDVNIHPKKHEVKFSDGEILIQLLKDLAEKTLMPNREFIKPIEEESKKENVNIFELYPIEEDIPINNTNQNVDKEIYVEKLESKNFEVQDNFFVEQKPYDITNVNDSIESYDKSPQLNNAHEVANEEVSNENEINLIDAKYVGCLFKTYLIFEQSNDKFFLVDQHAAHERVKYEKFVEQFNLKQVDSQILLKPEIFNVNSVELDKFDTFTENLKIIGFDVEKFSDNSLIVRAIPAIISVGFEDFLRQSLEVIDASVTSAYQINPYSLMKKACKAAVKGNENLSVIEIKQLIKDLVNCNDPFTCPHGRPTVLQLNKKDLEKIFLRG